MNLRLPLVSVLRGGCHWKPNVGPRAFRFHFANGLLYQQLARYSKIFYKIAVTLTRFSVPLIPDTLSVEWVPNGLAYHKSFSAFLRYQTAPPRPRSAFVTESSFSASRNGSFASRCPTGARRIWGMESRGSPVGATLPEVLKASAEFRAT